jgi:hypothetical protein
MDFTLELLDELARRAQMLLQRDTPPERCRTRIGANFDAVLRQRRKIDQTGLCQRRYVLRQQSIEKLAMSNPEVGQRVVIYAHSTAHPTIRILALAQPCQPPRTPHALARCVKPQAHQQTRSRRRMPRTALARLDRSFQRRQVQPLNIGPEQSRRMILAKQTVQVHWPQFDLIAHRLAQARLACCSRPFTPRRGFGKILEQATPSHHFLQPNRWSKESLRLLSCNRRQPRRRKIHAL